MFKVPATHRSFFIDPAPDKWKGLIRENRKNIPFFRPWTLGCAHQSSLYHPGVLFREALTDRVPVKRKVHISCDTSLVKERDIKIPDGSDMCVFQYYSFKDSLPYCRVPVPGKEKLKNFMRMSPRSRCRDFFNEALRALPYSENIASLNTNAKVRFLQPHKYRLPQVYLGDIIDSLKYESFIKKINKRKKEFIRVYNDSLKELPYNSGIAPLKEEKLPLRRRGGGSAPHPKALLLNIFFRLHVFDFYIQGVGESIYGEAADYIIRNFFNCSPPRTATASFTLYLGARDPAGLEKEIIFEKVQLRRMRENPQEYSSSPADSIEIRNIIEELGGEAVSKKEIYLKLREAKSKIREKVKNLIQNQEKKVRKLKNIKDMTSREYPYFAYGEEDISYLFKKGEEALKRYR